MIRVFSFTLRDPATFISVFPSLNNCAQWLEDLKSRGHWVPQTNPLQYLDLYCCMPTASSISIVLRVMGCPKRRPEVTSNYWTKCTIPVKVIGGHITILTTKPDGTPVAQWRCRDRCYQELRGHADIELTMRYSTLSFLKVQHDNYQAMEKVTADQIEEPTTDEVPIRN